MGEIPNVRTTLLKLGLGPFRIFWNKLTRALVKTTDGRPLSTFGRGWWRIRLLHLKGRVVQR